MELIRGWESPFAPGAIGGIRLSKASVFRAAGEEDGVGDEREGVHLRNRGYDLTSIDSKTGDLRLIAVKGLAAPTGTILFTPNDRRMAEDRRLLLAVHRHQLRGRTPAPRAGRESGAVPLAGGQPGPGLLAGSRLDDPAGGAARGAGGVQR